jgi:hypothetical protein
MQFSENRLAAMRSGALPCASRLNGYPWRCLWRGLVQMTYTRPCRLISLQFSQIRFTLERTFMIVLNRAESRALVRKREL